ncbi:hypothetical protein [Nocardiopsis sp. LOL_012]|uniref:DUF7144 family membrane protein n=1 Tax=Nocardiopsis sp. LOL_012 TaxID=3345409 RepID=UPI003A8C22C3
MRKTSANGWQFFVATLLIVIGVINIGQGLVALVTPEFYIATEANMLFLEYGAWGALLALWGAVLVIAGFSVLSGSTWARVFGVVLAALNIIAQLVFLFAMPLWSLVVIAVNVLVIYGMTAGWPSKAELREQEAREAEASYRAGYRAAHEKPREEKARTEKARHAAEKAGGETREHEQPTG